MTENCHFCRQIIFIDAINLDDALQKISTSKKLLTVIDMTTDFNQNKWLGQELTDTLIYFNNDSKPNGLLSLFGCIKAPHTLFLSCDTTRLTDYFTKHILLPKLQSIEHIKQNRNHHIDDAEREISQALSELIELKQGIIHIIGERGSGKSTLLGKYLKLLSEEKQNILLSSPSLAASKNTLLVANDTTKIMNTVSRETFKFSLPKDLLTHIELAKIILIDEAATYDKLTLENIINHIQKSNKLLILSTTIEGYEGTGQSYRLNHLNKGNPKIIELKIPKRFSINDSLYCLSKEIYRPSSSLTHNCGDADNGIHILNTKELREKGWTSACFALLKQAHYKTTPNDLARFYNDEAIFCICIQEQKIIGAAYALHEHLPNTINVKDIYNGKRRTKNALTQQALLQAYGGLLDNGNNIPHSNILRISRIAVNNKYRRQGIASQLIDTLKQFAILDNQHYDYLSTSFSHSDETLAFWKTQKFTPVRVGLYPNKANNAYAVLMLYELNNVSRETCANLVAFFQQHIEYFSSIYKKLFNPVIEPPKVLTRIDEKKAIEEIISVYEHHRDINWALPILSQYQEMIKSDENLSVLFDGNIRQKTTKQQDMKQLNKMKQQLSQFRHHQ